MSKTFSFNLAFVGKNIVKVMSCGETAGYIAVPENEHQNQHLFAVTQNGKDIGYQHCAICAIKSIIQKYERIPTGEDFDIASAREIVTPVHAVAISIH
ncbi:TPA: hypothetical protein ACKP2S_002203 [Serratia marcescens]|uniref:hypothetical protein n=1 Tax=Serratia marcescens TaxID=615 RepID=UPI0038C3736C